MENRIWTPNGKRPAHRQPDDLVRAGDVQQLFGSLASHARHLERRIDALEAKLNIHADLPDLPPLDKSDPTDVD